MHRPALAASLAAAALVVAAALLAQAGPLSPPAGPVAATPKTLTQVEPRTPISTAPITISQPGSYYLTRGLAVASGSAITVTAPDVTIDLNGFSLRATSTSALRGIDATPAATGLRVRNGAVIDFFGNGVHIEGRDAEVSDLRVTRDLAPGGFAFGIALYGPRARVTGCTVRTDTANGMNVGVYAIGEDARVDASSAFNCTSGFSLGPNAVVTRSRAAEGGNGFFAADGAAISDCTANRNSGMGFRIGTGSLTGCVARENEYGFTVVTAGVITSSSARLNLVDGFRLGFNGFSNVGDVQLIDSAAYDNGRYGVHAGEGATVRGCTAALNGRAGGSTAEGGIRLAADTVADSNLAHANVGAGISCSGNNVRIENNTCIANTTNAVEYFSNTFLVRNASANSVTGSYIPFGVNSVVGPFNQIVGTITSNNPWTNFLY